jgi:hypothetical protein
MKRTWALILLGCVLLAGYASYRQTVIVRLDRETRSIKDRIASQQELQRTVTAQSQRLAGTSDVAQFVEALYAIAREAGLDDHVVTTSQRQDTATTGRWRAAAGKPGEQALRISRLQMVAHGEFAAITAYLERLEALGQPKQIIRFELAPEETSLRALVLLDLYQLGRVDDHGR